MLRVEVLREPADAAAHRSEWLEVSAQACSWSAGQLPEYILAAWKHTPKDPDTSAAIILVWEGDRLACIWPLYVHRQGRLKIVTHIGCGSGDEYSGPLIVEDSIKAEVARVALGAARRLGDTLEVYAADPQSPMARAIRGAYGIKYVNMIPSPAVRLSAYPDFNTWLATKSKTFREGLRRKRRRLAEQGKVSFARQEGADGRDFVRWLFALKRADLDRRHIAKSWVMANAAEDLFVDLALKPGGAIYCLAIKLDDRFVAGSICFRSKNSFEWFTTAYDPKFSIFSPGELLIEDCARLASGMGIDFDFRVTRDAYKLRWSDYSDVRQTAILANTLLGVSRALQLHAFRALRESRQRTKAIFLASANSIRQATKSTPAS